MCRESKKKVQIHHIDDDPANNVVTNLAVLCFECHGDTQLRGGFGRKLDAEQVLLYRDDWREMVAVRRAEHVKATAAKMETEADRVSYITSVVEALREAGQYDLVAGIYDDIGNVELRDKYVNLALESNPSDAAICWLRGMQGRPDLIPDEVAERRLEKQAEREDWSQRARTLHELGRPYEATIDYLRSVKEDLDAGKTFSAAYYLKEAVEEGAIDTLFERALDEATAAGDLWWAVRALQELGWQSELDALVIQQAPVIREGRNPDLQILLLEAEGAKEEARALRAEVSKSLRVSPSGEGVGHTFAADDDDEEDRSPTE